MFSETNTYFYRTLTKTEQESAESAIRWLVRQHLKARQIALLKVENLDREGKAVEIAYEFKRLTVLRRIGYKGTALDDYLANTFPHLKSRDWLFPTSVYRGRGASFGFHVHVDRVENFIKNDRKKVLYILKKYSKIELSTKGLHIQNQQMVGRR